MYNDLCLPVEIAGLTFKNPFYVSSGPTARTVNQLIAIEKAGWSAASLKLSIDPKPYINRYPRYAVFKQYDALAFTAEKRLTFDEGRQLMCDGKRETRELLLMANIAYAGEDGLEGWVRMAKGFEDAGADIIELNMCCPNMSFNVQATAGDAGASRQKSGASIGKDADIVAEVTAAVKKAVKIPVFVKLTPEGGEIGNVAKTAHLAGADAVSGTGNRLGMPPIDLERPESSAYHLQKEISMGCFSGGWLKPLAQRDTYEMRKICGPDVPILATGGIRTAGDALEMAMCGADMVGICTETLMSGYNFIGGVIRETKQWLDARGYGSFRDVRDRVVPSVKSAPELTIYQGYAECKNPLLIAPCKAACPQSLPIQAVLKYAADGDWNEAFKYAEGSALCADCAAPCQKACVKGRATSALSIRAIMLYLLEKAAESVPSVSLMSTPTQSLWPEPVLKPYSGSRNLQSLRPPSQPSVSRARDVLSSRHIDFAERVYKAPANDCDVAAEAARCLKCGCGAGCGVCAEICPEFAIRAGASGEIVIDASDCTACGMCMYQCPNNNVGMVNTTVGRNTNG